jgi:hypothetical protein
MTVTQLASKVAKTEGLKKQVSIGNVREMLAVLSDIITADPTALQALVDNGKRRARDTKAGRR